MEAGRPRAVSSSSQAARGSPSRGWPTLPGLSSQLPPPRSSRAPSPAWAPRIAAVLAGRGPGEEERHVGVADQPDALLLDVEAGVGLLGRRGRTPRPGRGARRGRGRRPRGCPAGSSSRTNSRVALRDVVARPVDRRRGGLREGGDVSAPSTARSWLPARQSAQRSRTRSAQASGSAPYPSTSPRHQISSTAAASIASSTASSAARLAWMSVIAATRRRPAYPARPRAHTMGR